MDKAVGVKYWDRQREYSCVLGAGECALTTIDATGQRWNRGAEIGAAFGGNHITGWYVYSPLTALFATHMRLCV